MPSSVRIALAQTCPVDPQPEQTASSPTPFANITANLAQISAWTATAAKQGAEVVVFPEYCVQGIFGPTSLHLSFPHAEIFNHLKATAKLHGICIVGTVLVGTPDESLNLPPFPASSIDSEEWKAWLKGYTVDEERPPTVYNRAFFIDETGKLVGSYHKRNLWHPERETMTAGEEENDVFHTKWGRAALLICWDVSHPMSGQVLSDLGVEIVFMPTYWKATDSEPYLSQQDHEPQYELNMVRSWCFARSVETETVWAMCNAGGASAEFMGGSGVWQPLRGLVGGLEAAEGIQIVNIDMGVLKVAKELYKIREDFSKMYPGRVGARSGV